MPRLQIGANRAGRSLDNFEVSLGMPTLCTSDAGFADELESLKANVSKKDYSAALDGISDDMVDSLTITGDVTNVKRRIAEYHAAGITLLQANPTPPGAYFPFYEGHLDGAPFPEFDFPAFLASVETFITSMSK